MQDIETGEPTERGCIATLFLSIVHDCQRLFQSHRFNQGRLYDTADTNGRTQPSNRNWKQTKSL